jgi:hypothetical protein
MRDGKQEIDVRKRSDRRTREEERRPWPTGDQRACSDASKRVTDR